MKINETLNKLPETVQNEVIETLKGWTGCYVERHEETGEWRVSTGCGLTKWHNPWQMVAHFRNTDIFTREEIKKYSDEYWAGADMSAW